ncbi:MAG: hypothetical protein AAF799_44955 [Myxococcota bacterium]
MGKNVMTTARWGAIFAGLTIFVTASAACDTGGSTDDDMFTGGGGATDDGGGNDDGSGTGGDDANADGSGGEEPEDQVTIEPANMVDDLEDGDDVITDSGGRVGAWFTYNDESAGGTQTPTGEFTPAQGGAGGSAFSASMSGSGFSEWGAGMGFDLNNPGDDSGGAGVKNPWDASGFTGVAFRARGNVPVRVALVTQAIVSEEFGGNCTPSEEEGMMCDDAHGQTFALNDTWTQYVVPFSSAQQGGWGLPADFDPATMTSIQFDVGADLDFEIYIDDIGFYQ